MLNWLFKKVVTFREKVAVDLGKQDEEKPFLDHLEDLRSMIMRMAITLLVVTVAAFFFFKDLMAIIEHPLVVAGIRDKVTIQNLGVTGAFMTAMNICLVAGVIVSFPILFYFILQFVLPGLRSNEKKVLFPALCVGGGLFITGVLFAYFLVCPRALTFFYEFSRDMDQSSAAVTGDKPPDKLIWERVQYVKFVCQFILIFGACFELPVVVLALVKLDILNYKVMKGSRGYAAVIICVVAAVVTPTQDALTLGLLAVPMYVLYEICIWLAWWMEKKDREQYPEYYKDQDNDAKGLEVADDWDNEEYNPWNEDSRGDDDDDGTKPKTTPAAVTAAAAAAAAAAVTTDTTKVEATDADKADGSGDATPAPSETNTEAGSASSIVSEAVGPPEVPAPEVPKSPPGNHEIDFEDDLPPRPYRGDDDDEFENDPKRNTD